MKIIFRILGVMFVRLSSSKATWYGDGPHLENDPSPKRHITILLRMVHRTKSMEMEE
ncbi:hypothetical protein Hanom_Chr04g00301131 [Helianthus anomalus]